MGVFAAASEAFEGWDDCLSVLGVQQVALWAREGKGRVKSEE